MTWECIPWSRDLGEDLDMVTSVICLLDWSFRLPKESHQSTKGKCGFVQVPRANTPCGVVKRYGRALMLYIQRPTSCLRHKSQISGPGSCSDIECCTRKSLTSEMKSTICLKAVR